MRERMRQAARQAGGQELTWYPIDGGYLLRTPDGEVLQLDYVKPSKLGFLVWFPVPLDEPVADVTDEDRETVGA